MGQNSLKVNKIARVPASNIQLNNKQKNYNNENTSLKINFTIQLSLIENYKEKIKNKLGPVNY